MSTSKKTEANRTLTRNDSCTPSKRTPGKQDWTASHMYDCQLVTSRSKQMKQEEYTLRGSLGEKGSKQLRRDVNKMKNNAENTEYIRSLYKKYLGKENVPSEKKIQTEEKKNRQENITSRCRQKLDFQPEYSEASAGQPPRIRMDKQNRPLQEEARLMTEEIRQKYQKKSAQRQTATARPTPTITKQTANILNFYEQMLDKRHVGRLQKTNNSIVLAMQTINQIRRGKK